MNFFRRVLLRVTDWARRLYRRVFKKGEAPAPPLPGVLQAPEPLAPAYTLKGSVTASRGRLAGAPMLLPTREFLLHIPPGHRASVAAPLVIWLHGCRQSPEAFRDGSRIVHWADQRGLMVLMPRQSQWANPLGCWNWFDQANQSGGGEAAIVLAQLRDIQAHWTLDRQRIWIAGLSSGAALAACAAVHGHRDIRAAAFVAGLASGAARSAGSALEVMKRGPEQEVAALAHPLAIPAEFPRFPALIIQGEDDQVVSPKHADELARQMLALNAEWPLSRPLRVADEVETGEEGGRRYRREHYRVKGQRCVEMLRIEGLGHAWSGGDPAFEFNDPAGPDTTRTILDFFASSSGAGR